jgi:hypothetical protein
MHSHIGLQFVILGGLPPVRALCLDLAHAANVFSLSVPQLLPLQFHETGNIKKDG